MPGIDWKWLPAKINSGHDHRFPSADPVLHTWHSIRRNAKPCQQAGGPGKSRWYDHGAVFFLGETTYEGGCFYRIYSRGASELWWEVSSCPSPWICLRPKARRKPHSMTKINVFRLGELWKTISNPNVSRSLDEDPTNWLEALKRTELLRFSSYSRYQFSRLMRFTSTTAGFPESSCGTMSAGCDVSL